jgi:hypothetical protein
MGPQPNDEQYLVVIVDRHYQSIIIALDIKDDSFSGDDAG